MTSLFRPWTEDGIGKSDLKGFGSFYAESLTEPELWLPKETETEASEPNRIEDRETKYRNVKEHVKKRSEKYFLKKLKSKSGEDKPEVGIDDGHRRDDRLPGTGTASFPPSFYPLPDGSVNPFDSFPGRTCPGAFLQQAHAFHPRGDILLEATSLAAGLPPNLFDEYARFLTEQQKRVADRSRKQRPKKFRCPHCQVGFSNNGQLKGHIRIHTGERPFKCDAESCGKSFTRNEELTRHRRIHSGLRPFPCSECGKRFGRKDHLKKHVKTHFQQRYQLVPILPGHCPYFYGL